MFYVIFFAFLCLCKCQVVFTGNGKNATFLVYYLVVVVVVSTLVVFLVIISIMRVGTTLEKLHASQQTPISLNGCGLFP